MPPGADHQARPVGGVGQRFGETATKPGEKPERGGPVGDVIERREQPDPGVGEHTPVVVVGVHEMPPKDHAAGEAAGVFAGGILWCFGADG